MLLVDASHEDWDIGLFLESIQLNIAQLENASRLHLTTSLFLTEFNRQGLYVKAT